ncbi:hypothetical protein SAMN05216428_11648 [Nitrosospira sp. Nsp11]|nr:hypothetical protein SAMN05216428_11648 [Nitrosospira sp. Nsp11]
MEAGWFKLDLYRGFFCLLPIIIFLGLNRWNITDGFEQALMVEPRYPSPAERVLSSDPPDYAGEYRIINSDDLDVLFMNHRNVESWC